MWLRFRLVFLGSMVHSLLWLYSHTFLNWRGSMEERLNEVMAKTSIAQIAYYLAILGGILMAILGLMSLLGVSSALRGLYFSIISGFWQGGIVMFIGGVVAIVGARRADHIVWALILIVVGIIGGGLGGLLAVIGGIVGLIAYTKKPWYKRLLPF